MKHTSILRRMAVTILRSESLMIHPRPGVIGANLINTIEIKGLMETATEKTRLIRTAESKDSSLQPKTREEERRAEKQREAAQARMEASEASLALKMIRDLKVAPLNTTKASTVELGGTIDYAA